MELLDLLAADKLKPVVAERIPLAEAARAHELLERGRGGRDQQVDSSGRKRVPCMMACKLLNSRVDKQSSTMQICAIELYKRLCEHD